MTVVWGLRLSMHIGNRKRGKGEDGFNMMEMLTWTGEQRLVPVIVRDGQAETGWEGGT